MKLPSTLIRRGESHVSSNHTLISRSFQRSADLSVPQVIGAHNDCSGTIRRHGQQEIFSILQGIATVCPVGGVGVPEISIVIGEGFGNVFKGVCFVDALGCGHARVDGV